MGVAAVVMFVVRGGDDRLIAPGFEGEQARLYVSLFRVMLVTPILFAASLTLGQVLLAEQRYFWYGIAPLLYNAGIIVGTLAVRRALGIFGPAIGAVIGAVAAPGEPVHRAARSSFRIGFEWDRSAPPSVRRVRAADAAEDGQPSGRADHVPVLHSGCHRRWRPGSVTAVSFARNFQSVPVSLVGVAFALAAFPVAVDRPRRGRSAWLPARCCARTWRTSSVLTIAAAVGLVVFGELAIGILLGGGAFGAG